MVNKIVRVKNPTGLQLKPAGALCNEATSYKSKIELIFNDNVINAKSVLNILGACIKMGDELEVVCEGPDENDALEKITQILEKGFA